MYIHILFSVWFTCLLLSKCVNWDVLCIRWNNVFIFSGRLYIVSSTHWGMSFSCLNEVYSITGSFVTYEAFGFKYYNFYIEVDSNVNNYS